MSAKIARKKGKTHAVIGTERAIEHLNAASPTHARDKARAQEARERVAGLIIAEDSPAETLKYPSLTNGIMLGAGGREISGEEHTALLTRLRMERGHYVMTQKRADGREYTRTRKTDGLRQLAITFRPEHALALARIDQAGIPVRAVVLEFADKLGKEFGKVTGYESVATQIHPEEGNLHIHLAYATVSKNGELLHPTQGIGRKGLRLAGPSVIGTLRLVDAGIWPEEDATLARAWLKDRKVGGSDPVDYALSGYLDGLVDKNLMGLGLIRSDAALIIKKAKLDYEADAKRRREERPDVIAKKMLSLQERNDELSAENIALRAHTSALEADNQQLRAGVAGLQAALDSALGAQVPEERDDDQEAPRRNRRNSTGLRP